MAKNNTAITVTVSAMVIALTLLVLYFILTAKKSPGAAATQETGSKATGGSTGSSTGGSTTNATTATNPDLLSDSDILAAQNATGEAVMSLYNWLTGNSSTTTTAPATTTDPNAFQLSTYINGAPAAVGDDTAPTAAPAVDVNADLFTKYGLTTPAGSTPTPPGNNAFTDVNY